ncbi:MAG: peptidoglycan DD-metalloendopeptidase family protein [Rhodospirillaceae bacterium]|nr:peptidoglycan DD-metalloendopeptidase family protein [Rhodospirillaceae bacterium]
MARLAKQSKRRKQAAKRPAPADKANDMRISPSATELIVRPALVSGGMPVLGRVFRRFGEPSKTGKNTRGISIRTRPGSTVVAPRNGRIVFAGPFRGLGNLLIIEYQAKYHLLLAGLARIDTDVGETVLAGEPVGMMTASQGAKSDLYVELRRNGQPINPLPWLAAGKPKVNG